MDAAASEDKPTDPVVAEGGASDQLKPGEKPSEAKKKLTPEEQMAAFEKAMKEEDWGHQPC